VTHGYLECLRLQLNDADVIYLTFSLTAYFREYNFQKLVAIANNRKIYILDNTRRHKQVIRHMKTLLYVCVQLPQGDRRQRQPVLLAVRDGQAHLQHHKGVGQPPEGVWAAVHQQL